MATPPIIFPCVAGTWGFEKFNRIQEDHPGGASSMLLAAGLEAGDSTEIRALWTAHARGRSCRRIKAQE